MKVKVWQMYALVTCNYSILLDLRKFPFLTSDTSCRYWGPVGFVVSPTGRSSSLCNNSSTILADRYSVKSFPERKYEISFLQMHAARRSLYLWINRLRKLRKPTFVIWAERPRQKTQKHAHHLPRAPGPSFSPHVMCARTIYHKQMEKQCKW